MTIENRDAEIIAASQKFCAAQMIRESLFKLITDDNERYEALDSFDEKYPDLLKIVADDNIRAIGMDAIRARATALSRSVSGDKTICRGDFEIAKCLINDLLGTGAFPWSPFPEFEAEAASREAIHR
jgi:hypothetical protein